MLGVHPLMGHNGGPSLNVADVFSTDLYTGNGGTQTITNGLNLSGEGGLTWIKYRTAGIGHYLYDTARGRAYGLKSNSIDGQVGPSSSTQDFKSFDSAGFTLGSPGFSSTNDSGFSAVAWSFRRAARFFDVVAYIGNGAGNRSIPHSLGVTPGLIIVKRTDAAADWLVQARANASSNYYLKLNQSGSSGSAWNGESLGLGSNSTFQVSTGGTTDTNISGASYVAYLFAHDAASDGVIQCGSYVGNGSSPGPLVNLGWRPQFILLKPTNLDGPWSIFDSARGLAPTARVLYANSPTDESAVGGGFQISNNGFQDNNTVSGYTYIYMAIRAEGT